MPPVARPPRSLAIVDAALVDTNWIALDDLSTDGAVATIRLPERSLVVSAHLLPVRSAELDPVRVIEDEGDEAAAALLPEGARVRGVSFIDEGMTSFMNGAVAGVDTPNVDVGCVASMLQIVVAVRFSNAQHGQGKAPLSGLRIRVDGFPTSRMPAAPRAVPLINLLLRPGRLLQEPQHMQTASLLATLALQAARRFYQASELALSGSLSCLAKPWAGDASSACIRAACLQIVAASALSQHTHTHDKIKCLVRAAGLCVASYSHRIAVQLQETALECLSTGVSSKVDELLLTVCSDQGIHLPPPPQDFEQPSIRLYLLAVLPGLWHPLLQLLQSTSGPIRLAAAGCLSTFLEHCGCSIQIVPGAVSGLLEVLYTHHPMLRQSLVGNDPWFSLPNVSSSTMQGSPVPAAVERRRKAFLGSSNAGLPYKPPPRVHPQARHSFDSLLEAIWALLPHLAPTGVKACLAVATRQLARAVCATDPDGVIDSTQMLVQASQDGEGSNMATTTHLREHQLRVVILALRRCAGDVECNEVLLERLLVQASFREGQVYLCSRLAAKAWVAAVKSISLQPPNQAPVAFIGSKLVAKARQLKRSVVQSSPASPIADNCQGHVGTPARKAPDGQTDASLMHTRRSLKMLLLAIEKLSLCWFVELRPGLEDMLAIVPSLASACQHLTHVTLFDEFTMVWSTLATMGRSVPRPLRIDLMHLAKSLLSSAADWCSTRTVTLPFLQFLHVVLKQCPQPGRSDIAFLHQLLSAFISCVPHSTNDETFFVLKELQRSCLGTLSPALYEQLLEALTHKFTLRSKAREACLALAEDELVLAARRAASGENEGLDAFGAAVHACSNLHLLSRQNPAYPDSVVDRLKILRNGCSRLGGADVGQEQFRGETMAAVDMHLATAWGNSMLLLKLSDSRIAIMALGVLSALGACISRLSPWPESDTLQSILEKDLFLPHQACFEDASDPELQLQALASVHVLLSELPGEQTVDNLRPMLPFGGGAGPSASPSPTDSPSSSVSASSNQFQTNQSPKSFDLRKETYAHRWSVHLWAPVANLHVSSPWLSISVSAAAVLCAISSRRRRHSSLPTAQHRTFQASMIVTLMRMLTGEEWRMRLCALQCLSLYCEARRQDALEVLLESPPRPMPPGELPVNSSQSGEESVGEEGMLEDETAASSDHSYAQDDADTNMSASSATLCHDNIDANSVSSMSLSGAEGNEPPAEMQGQSRLMSVSASVSVFEFGGDVPASETAFSSISDPVVKSTCQTASQFQSRVSQLWSQVEALRNNWHPSVAEAACKISNVAYRGTQPPQDDAMQQLLQRLASSQWPELISVSNNETVEWALVQPSSSIQESERAAPAWSVAVDNDCQEQDVGFAEDSKGASSSLLDSSLTRGYGDSHPSAFVLPGPGRGNLLAAVSRATFAAPKLWSEATKEIISDLSELDDGDDTEGSLAHGYTVQGADDGDSGSDEGIAEDDSDDEISAHVDSPGSPSEDLVMSSVANSSVDSLSVPNIDSSASNIIVDVDAEEDGEVWDNIEQLPRLKGNTQTRPSSKHSRPSDTSRRSRRTTSQPQVRPTSPPLSGRGSAAVTTAMDLSSHPEARGEYQPARQTNEKIDSLAGTRHEYKPPEMRNRPSRPQDMFVRRPTTASHDAGQHDLTDSQRAEEFEDIDNHSSADEGDNIELGTGDVMCIGGSSDSGSDSDDVIIDIDADLSDESDGISETSTVRMAPTIPSVDETQTNDEDFDGATIEHELSNARMGISFRELDGMLPYHSTTDAPSHAEAEAAGELPHADSRQSAEMDEEPPEESIAAPDGEARLPGQNDAGDAFENTTHEQLRDRMPLPLPQGRRRRGGASSDATFMKGESNRSGVRHVGDEVHAFGTTDLEVEQQEEGQHPKAANMTDLVAQGVKETTIQDAATELTDALLGQAIADVLAERTAKLNVPASSARASTTEPFELRGMRITDASASSQPYQGPVEQSAMESPPPKRLSTGERRLEGSSSAGGYWRLNGQSLLSQSPSGPTSALQSTSAVASLFSTEDSSPGSASRSKAGPLRTVHPDVLMANDADSNEPQVQAHAGGPVVGDIRSAWSVTEEGTSVPISRMHAQSPEDACRGEIQLATPHHIEDLYVEDLDSDDNSDV